MGRGGGEGGGAEKPAQESKHNAMTVMLMETDVKKLQYVECIVESSHVKRTRRGMNKAIRSLPTHYAMRIAKDALSKAIRTQAETTIWNTG